MKNSNVTYPLLVSLSTILLLVISGCSIKGNDTTDNDKRGEYQKISAAQAKEIIDDQESVLIVDVRTPSEYDSGHIPGAINLPDYELIDNASTILQDTSIPILVYCRSGRRSAISANDLLDLGYQTVYDFGGIIDWEYDITAPTQ